MKPSLVELTGRTSFCELDEIGFGRRGQCLVRYAPRSGLLTNPHRPCFQFFEYVTRPVGSEIGRVVLSMRNQPVCLRSFAYDTANDVGNWYHAAKLSVDSGNGRELTAHIFVVVVYTPLLLVTSVVSIRSCTGSTFPRAHPGQPPYSSAPVLSNHKLDLPKAVFSFVHCDRRFSHSSGPALSNQGWNSRKFFFSYATGTHVFDFFRPFFFSRL